MNVKKYILNMMLIIVLTFLMTACSASKSILGEWKYDIAENADPDMKGITVSITEDTMTLHNDINGYEATMELTYEKDDTTMIITAGSINGQPMDYGDEDFIEIPYTLLDKKLMLDLSDTGLGKVIFCRNEK